MMYITVAYTQRHMTVKEKKRMELSRSIYWLTSVNVAAEVAGWDPFALWIGSCVVPCAPLFR